MPPPPKLDRPLRPDPRSRHRPWFAPALGAVLGLLAGAATGAEPSATQPTTRLRILFANSLIQNVNRSDVLAAFELWIETVGRNRGFSLEAETDSYDRLGEVEKRLQHGTLDMVIFTTIDYLQLGQDGPLEPVFSPVRSRETLFDQYVLVTNSRQNLSTLSALRGKSVVFYQHGANLGRRWMELTLGEGGLGSLEDFFGIQSDYTKPSAVVLPVFFGKFEAGVVTRSSLDTMKEMNPQLGTQLQVVAQSPRLAESVICLHRDYDGFRGEVLAGLADLHSEPRGQQLLLVFKIDCLMPFKSEYLDAVRELEARRRGPMAPNQGTVATTASSVEPDPQTSVVQGSRP